MFFCVFRKANWQLGSSVLCESQKPHDAVGRPTHTRVSTSRSAVSCTNSCLWGVINTRSMWLDALWMTPVMRFTVCVSSFSANWCPCTRPRDWLGRASPKWPILCRVGHKTLTQSMMPEERHCCIYVGFPLPVGLRHCNAPQFICQFWRYINCFLTCFLTYLLS